MTTDVKKISNESPLLLRNSLDSTAEDGEFDESFQCCVCLDLLYKPVVLACGHIACFWCVSGAMNIDRESRCPLCCCQYNHFPAICQLLHFLLLKMYPVAYKRREKEILEEEKELDYFSPQLSANLSSSHTCKESNVLDAPFTSSTICLPMENVRQYDGTSSSGTINPSIIVEQQSPDMLVDENTSKASADIQTGLDVSRTLAMEENDANGGNSELVSVDEVLCFSCKELLFRPVVLNCGHVYRQSCVATRIDEALKCQICQSLHPKGFLKVCLELDHLLEKRFPEEYALRRQAYQIDSINGQQVAGQDGKLNPKSSSSDLNSSRLCGQGLNVHVGVGCDHCGMFPLIGERYRCKDCVEEVGFDLCGECYNTLSKLPGRFNQQHTSEHKFELVHVTHSPMLYFTSELSEDTFVSVLSDDSTEDPEAVLPYLLSDDASDDED